MDHIEQRPMKIGLVAHDNKKTDLMEWVEYNRTALASHELWATGTTGTLLEYELGLPVVRVHSGPLGGDQQLGAMIASGEIDLLVFFWGSPRTPTPRPRCQGPPPYRRGVEHPRGQQPDHRRLHHLLAAHRQRLPARRPRLCNPSHGSHGREATHGPESHPLTVPDRGRACPPERSRREVCSRQGFASGWMKRRSAAAHMEALCRRFGVARLRVPLG